MNIPDIARGLADLVGQTPGVRGYPYRVSNFASSGDGLVAAMVVPGPEFVNYYEAMVGGQAMLRWVIQVRVPAVAEEKAFERLYRCLSAGVGEPESIYDTVKPDDLPQTLGGLIDDLRIGVARMGVSEEAEGAVYIGADLEVDMLVSRRHT